MTVKELRFSGYLSILAAIAVMPLIMLVFYSEIAEAHAYLKFLQIVNLVLFLINTHKLILFLTEMNFTEANKLLIATICLNSFAVVWCVIHSFTMISIPGLLALMAQGIVMIVTGLVLQKSRHLYGLENSFSISWIVTGICMTSLILLPAAMLTWAMLYLVQGMIFFRAARQQENNSPGVSFDY